MTINKLKNIFIAVSFLLLVSGFTKAQTCEMDSSFAPSNVDFPSKIKVGERVRVRVNIFNSGTCLWSTRFVKLTIRTIRKPSGSPYPLEEFKSELPLRQSISPKEEHTWYYEVTGPAHPGAYELEWTLVTNLKPFGSSVRKTVQVVP